MNDELTPAPDEQPGEQPPKNAETEDAMAELEQKLTELEDKYRRALADLANLHKRFQREREQLHSLAVTGFAAKFLPLVDNLAHSLKTANETHDAAAILEGLRILQSQLLQIFKENGIQPIESVGKPFNPEFHHAIAAEATDKVPPGTVLEESGPGFRMGDHVIRPAQVKVSVAPQAGNESTQEKK